MINSKNITLCADDFGLNLGVSHGILKLARQGRLSAVSCMVNGPDFITSAPELINCLDQVQHGLHFNLTEGHLLSDPDMSCFSLNKLLMKTHLCLIDQTLIAQEFHAQLDAYIQTVGHLPDFIDGHQHVHQFPGIRQVVLDIYEKRLKHNGTWIRSTYPAITLPKYRFKALVLAATGGRALRARLQKLKAPSNAYFSGVYDFSPTTDYRALFRQWLELVPTDTLIMCHPGEQAEKHDEIAVTRQLELDYFSSDAFMLDCEEFGVQLN